MRKYYIADVADCVKRKLDTIRFKNYMTLNGFVESLNPSDCDYIFINSCGVTNDKVQEALDKIQELHEYDGQIIIAGCAITTDESLFDNTLIKLPTNNLEKIDEELSFNVLMESIPSPVKKNDDEKLCYLVLCHGCTESCSYCATRKAIGNICSYTINECLNRLKSILAENPDRIILCADNIGAYGIDIGVNFSALLNAMSPFDKKFILGIDMLHPFYFLQHFSAIEERMIADDVGYILIPIQSGNQRILSLMNRRGEIKTIKDYICKMKNKYPGVIWGTHIILGFPTESENEFIDSLNLITDIGFDWVRFFGFSPRNGTKFSHISDRENLIIQNRIQKTGEYMKEHKYFINYNASGLTACKKYLVIDHQYDENPYRLPCYREVISP